MQDINNQTLTEIRDLLKEQNDLISSIKEANEKMMEVNAKSIVESENLLKKHEKIRSGQNRSNIIFMAILGLFVGFYFVANYFS